MRNRAMVVLIVGAITALAMSGTPRYVEELCVGGGRGDLDGGIDLEATGDVATDGDLTVGGQITAGAGAHVLTDEEGLVNGANLLNGSVAGAKLEASGATPGSYSNATVTVDAHGRVTAIEEGAAIPETEEGLESLLADVVDVYTDSDGLLSDDDLTDDGLESLANVSSSAATDGDVLVYNAAASQWEPGASAGGAESIGDLDDVDTSGVTDGQVLKWAASSGDWAPGDDATGSGLPAGGVGGQMLQHDGDGTAKWISISGEAAVADGGAVTLQGSPSFVNGSFSGDVAVNGGEISSTGDLTVSADNGEGMVLADGILQVKRLSGASTENNPKFHLRDSDVNHGWITNGPTDAILTIRNWSSLDGGAIFDAVIETQYGAGLYMRGINTVEPTQQALVQLAGARKGFGSTLMTIADSSKLFTILNHETTRLAMNGAGDTTFSGDLAVEGGDITCSGDLNITANDGDGELVLKGATEVWCDGRSELTLLDGSSAIVNDEIGRLVFCGKDATSAVRTYASVRVTQQNVGYTTTEGKLEIDVIHGGENDTVFELDGEDARLTGTLTVEGKEVDIGDAGGFSGVRFNATSTQLEFYLDGLQVGHIGTDGAYVDDVG